MLDALQQLFRLLFFISQHVNGSSQCPWGGSRSCLGRAQYWPLMRISVRRSGGGRSRRERLNRRPTGLKVFQQPTTGIVLRRIVVIGCGGGSLGFSSIDRQLCLSCPVVLFNRGTVLRLDIIRRLFTRSVCFSVVVIAVIVAATGL